MKHQQMINTMEAVTNITGHDLEEREIKKFEISQYFNVITGKETYGITLVFGRKKSEKLRMPQLFTKKTNVEKMCADLEPMVGQTLKEFVCDKRLRNAMKKYSSLSCNKK